jgi:hypothetical protein
MNYTHIGKDGVKRVKQLVVAPMTVQDKLRVVQNEAARRIEQVEGPPGAFSSRGWRLERARDIDEANGNRQRERQLRAARRAIRARSDEIQAEIEALPDQDALEAYDIAAAFDA